MIVFDHSHRRKIAMTLDDLDVHAFLAYLRARGLTLRVDDRLLVAPGGAILLEDAELIRLNKAAILAALQWEADERVNDEIDAAVAIIEARLT